MRRSVRRVVVGTSPIPTYQANGRVSVITVANGTVYIGGSFTSVRPAGSSGSSTTRNHAAAFDEATGALLSWNPNVSGNVRAIEIVGSTAYLGGSFSTVGGSGRHDLAAVDAGGTGAVQSWNPGASSQVLDMGQIGGVLYVGGDFTPVDGTSQSHIAALDPSTGAPLSWATHEPYTVIDLDVDANGVLVAGGGNGGNFASLDPLTGARQWIGGTDGNVQAIAVVGGVVYAGGHWANYCRPDVRCAHVSAPDAAAQAAPRPPVER